MTAWRKNTKKQRLGFEFQNISLSQNSLRLRDFFFVLQRQIKNICAPGGQSQVYFAVLEKNGMIGLL